MILLAWVAIAIGALLALLLLILVAVLLTPVDMEAVWGESGRRLAFAGPGLRVTYDAGDRSTELRLLSMRLGRWQARTEPGRRRAKKEKRAKKARPRRFSLRRAWAERRHLLRALRGFLRRVRLRRLVVDTVVASPDPALTGWLSGAVYAGRAVLPARFRTGVRVRPDFVSEVPRLSVDASLRVRPVHAAVLAVRMWRVMRRARGAPATRGAGKGSWRTWRQRAPAGGGRKERGP